jgi:tape measure domain-containing protein
MTAPIMAISNAVSHAAQRFNALEAAANVDASSLAAVRSQIDLAGSAATMVNQAFQDTLRNIEAAENGQRGFNERVRQGGSAADGLTRRIMAAAAAYASFQTVQKVVGLSDEMATTTARLDLMNDGLQTTGELQEKIYQSARRSRGAYLATAGAVAKLGVLAKNAFSSNDEIIAFAEQMNKQFVIGGASVQEQQSAMYQLTQAMAAGKLQGDEFRSIMENAPLLAQAIADKMGKTTGELKEMSSQGVITADVIKAALFAAAEETDARFLAMPRTWAQAWQGAANALLMAFQPVLLRIGEGAGWLVENWSEVAPLLYGAAAGAVALAVGLGVQTAATWVATGAAKAFFAALLTNPLTWVVLGIGLVVAAVYKWAQSVGGLKVAWLIAVNAVLSAWDWLKIGFLSGVYWALDLWDKLRSGVMGVAVAIANALDGMRADVLTALQNMVNGAIGIINEFISLLNKIPGVSIGLIGQVTFGAAAQLESEAAKQARLEGLSAYREEIDANVAGREAALDAMGRAALKASAGRLEGIRAARAESAAGGFDDPYGGVLQTIADNTAAQAGYSEEELKLWRDVAERDAVNRFTTAEVTVDFGGVTNNVSSEMDLDGIADYIAERTEEALLAVAEGVGW